MTEADGLAEAFSRLPDLVSGAVHGLTPAQLRWAPTPDANSIGWLIWHLTRVQDHHVSALLDEDQIWTSDDWAEAVGLDPDPDNTGYGHTPDDVASVQPSSSEVLVDYFDAVSTRTLAMIANLTAADLARVVDDSWDPPVTMRVRLSSVLGDDLQHIGQAAYVRGLLPDMDYS
jgi:Protein of unknown function (DUF664)